MEKVAFGWMNTKTNQEVKSEKETIESFLGRGGKITYCPDHIPYDFYKPVCLTCFVALGDGCFASHVNR